MFILRVLVVPYGLATTPLGSRICYQSPNSTPESRGRRCATAHATQTLSEVEYSCQKASNCCMKVKETKGLQLLNDLFGIKQIAKQGGR